MILTRGVCHSANILDLVNAEAKHYSSSDKRTPAPGSVMVAATTPGRIAADVVVFASGYATSAMQEVQHCEVHDIRDHGHPQLARASVVRAAAYERDGFIAQHNPPTGL